MKKWKRVVIVAVAVVAAAGLWRLKYEVEYGGVDRRIERLRAELAAAAAAQRPEIVRQAASDLSTFTRPSHIRRLAWHLGDDDKDICRAAGDALLSMGGRAVEPIAQEIMEAAAYSDNGLVRPLLRLANLLPRDYALLVNESVRDSVRQRRDRAERVAARCAEVLVTIGAPARPAIMRLAGEDGPLVEPVMSEALSSLHTETAYEIAVELIARDGPQAHAQLVTRLAQVAEHEWLPDMDPRACEAIAGVLDGPDGDMTQAAILILGALESAAADEALGEFVESGRPPRFRAAGALALHGDARALPALLEAVESQDAYAPEAVVRLAFIPDGRAIDGIVTAAASPEATIRASAAHALGLVAQMDLAAADAKQRAREALLKLADDENGGIRRQASEAMKPGLMAGRMIAAAAQREPNAYQDARLRQGYVRALGDYAGDDVTDALVAALSDMHPWVRRAAARSLGRIAKRGSVSEAAKAKVREGLEKAKGDADASVRQAAGEALDALEAK